MSVMFWHWEHQCTWIYERQNDDSSLDDEWASWRVSPSPRKWWLIIAPSQWVINERHVLTLGASMYMIHERQNDDSSSDAEWASWPGSPSPRKWWLIIAPSPWVINERHVLTLGASMYMIHEQRMMTHPQMMNRRHVTTSISFILYGGFKILTSIGL